LGNSNHIAVTSECILTFLTNGILH
jgi:hypothetical protein